MKILIQGATLIDRESPFHKKKKNVLLTNGRIASVSDKSAQADKVIDADGMFLSPGWFDLGTFAGDPGFEQKETLDSVAQAAAAGGFTELALLPNTNPCVQTKNDILYITGGNRSRLVQLHALASVTRNNKGEDLTEMIDLAGAGAVGFTDGLRPLWHTDIFQKSLQYLQKTGRVLIDHPEDQWLSMFGQMHEGKNSTSLGLRGIPRIAEEVTVARNLELLGYAGGRLHLSRISSARSVRKIRAARSRGMNVTCDVASYQPLLDDSLLADFDTNYKMSPPLRERSDQEAILRGLKDGTISVLCSGHLPQDAESKQVEFDHAEPGIINLQTFASQLAQLSKSVPMARLIETVTYGPREVLNLPVPGIAEDTSANLTLFDPQREWVFDADTNLSKSLNSPWLGQKLKGRAVAVFGNGRQYLQKGE
jgi:dihydroorotase